MDDLAKALAIGFVALVTIHLSLEARFRREARDVVRSALGPGGSIVVEDRPHGLFGLLNADLTSVDITGSGLAARAFPFLLHPRAGWSGRIRTLRLHLRSCSLGGLAIDSVEASIPSVGYDANDALWKYRLTLRSAGVGQASVLIRFPDIAAYIERQSSGGLSGVRIENAGDSLHITGNVRAFGQQLAFDLRGTPALGNSGSLTLQGLTVLISGEPAAPPIVALLQKAFEDQIDLVRDTGLQAALNLESVSVLPGAIRVEAGLKLPSFLTSTKQ